MVEQDPKEFIRTYLSLPRGSDEPSPPPPANSRVGGQPEYPFRGAGKGAKTATIQFLKQRSLPHDQVHAITFEDEAGLKWDFFCSIAQDERGFWHMSRSGCVRQGMMQRTSRTFPWVHLVGGSGESYLWAGGYVTDKATDAQRVRLITKNGLTLEDSVQDGIVLFQTDQHVEIPAQVEVYTGSGTLSGTQALFDYPAC